jgi:Alpha and gamma adaptin binding protein p34
LHDGIARFEPEVALAISLGNGSSHPDDPPEGPDSYLADHGFEYIDGERTRHPTTDADADEDEDEDLDVVQGLPRIVDALSTIMWPSMVREPGNGKNRKSQAPSSLFDFDVLRTEEDTLAALMEADAAEHGVPQTRASRMQREMATLERWLIENEELHEAEFRGTSTSPDIIDDEDDGEGESEQDEEHNGGDDGDGSSILVSVPHLVPVPSGDPWASSNNNSTLSTAPLAKGGDATASASGFDDDFTAFVSAPALPTPSSTTILTTTSGSADGGGARRTRALLDAPILLPSHTGSSYRSLRSTAFDMDDHVGYEALDDHSSSFEFEFSPKRDDEDPDYAPTRGGHRASSSGLEVDNDDNVVPLDLTNILSALQTVREDVAGIGDEAQRREMTARFASEFVFKRMGMDGDDDEMRETLG